MGPAGETGLEPALEPGGLRISELLASDGVRVADGTLIGVANYAGCQSRSEFAGTVKCQMRLEQHLAKTPGGLVQRIQRLLALTLGMLINALTGRPPRSLVAYDGR